MHHDALVNRLLVYQREGSFVTLFGKNSFRRLVLNYIETVGEHIGYSCNSQASHFGRKFLYAKSFKF